MDERNLKPNSHRYKAEQKEIEERKRPEKVINGQAKTRKKNPLVGTVISEEATNVKSYVLMEVLIPAFKKLVSDVVTDGIDMILYGESGRSRKKSGNAHKVSYSSYYDDRDRGARRSSESRRDRYSYDDIVLETKGEAVEVLARMDEIMDEYKMVRVADLYDLVGITGEYTDNDYGWTNIRSAEVQRVRDGWIIKMPRPLPIK